MIRLIGVFLIFALFLAFIMLNLENKNSVNFGFYSFEEVPIYITVFISIFAGMIFSIPLVSSIKKRKSNPEINARPGKRKKISPDYKEEIPEDNGPYGIN